MSVPPLSRPALEVTAYGRPARVPSEIERGDKKEVIGRR